MFRADLIRLLIVVLLYRCDWGYLVQITLARRCGGKGRNRPLTSQCGVSRAIVGEKFRIELCELVTLGGLYRRGGKYLVMATLMGRRGGKWRNHPWSSSVRSSCASVGGVFRIRLCGLLLLMGLYRRGGKYLVMATLGGRNGGKGRNRPWSS